MKKKIGNIYYENKIDNTIYAILRGVVIIGALLTLVLYSFHTLNNILQ